MNKPTTKAELLKGIRDERKRLENALKGLADAEMTKAEAVGAWSVKDILAHIAAWEKSFLKWYETGLRGEKQVMPDWKKPGIIDAINRQIYQRSRKRALKEVLAEFRASYRLILKTVEDIPEDAIFVPAKYDWLGKATLADYIFINTTEHYMEHLAMIDAIRKKLRK